VSAALPHTVLEDAPVMKHGDGAVKCRRILEPPENAVQLGLEKGGRLCADKRKDLLLGSLGGNRGP
jgi:hypothetical protein